jgi:hypothetical protein
MGERLGQFMVPAFRMQRLDVAAAEGDALRDENAGAGFLVEIRKIGSRDRNRKGGKA